VPLWLGMPDRWLGHEASSTRSARGRGQHGAALLELTIVLPLVVALALGIFTGGTAYFRKISIVDAVREGARYGATLRVPTGVGGEAAWEASVRGRVAQASAGELSSANICVKLVYASGGTDCGIGDPAGASAETTIRLVKVSASKAATIEFFFFTSTPTLTGKVAARYERDTG
jgi:Flp pilus assembly protein TadG